MTSLAKNRVVKFVSLLPKSFIVKLLLLGIVFSIGFIVEFLSPIIQKRFIDFAIESKNIFNEHLYQLVILYSCVAISTIIVSFSFANIKVSVNKFYFFYFLRKVLNLSKKKIKTNGTGYYYDLISKDVENASSIINLSWFSLLFSTLQLCGILFVVFRWSKIIFLVFIISFLSSLIVSVIFTILNRKNYRNMRKYSSVMAKETIETISNNSTIKYFQVIDNFINYIVKSYKSFESNLRKYIVVAYFPESILKILQISSYLFIIIYSLHLITEGIFTYGNLIAIIGYFGMVKRPISNFENLMAKLSECDVSISRLSNANYSQPKLTTLVNTKDLDELRFNKVKFSHVEDLSTSESLYLDFKVTAGTALLGLSGVGKSTIVDLLLKENIPNCGEILLNKVSIDSFNNSSYFSKVNILQQETDIFSKSLFFNLTLGRKTVERTQVESTLNMIIRCINAYTESITGDSASIKDGIIGRDEDLEKIEMIINREYSSYIKQRIDSKDMFSESEKLSIAKSVFNQCYVDKLKIEEIIDELDLSYLENRDLGENGSKISGGEKHKIAFARFLTKEFYDFYILDEPFSNLDLISEKILLRCAQRFLKNKKGIIISHKLNLSIALAKHFVVFEDKKVQKYQSLSELKIKSPLFHELKEESLNNYEVIHN